MKFVHKSGIRKSSIARATAMKGSGIIRINGILLENYTPQVAQMKIKEPLLLAGKEADSVDIKINVKGGGYMSQAEAVRLAIGRALADFSKSKKLRETFLEYDRQLIVADVRRKEMYKPNDSKARAKRQKSYR
ncbi:MAG: 30S ribosomal protein S9 [Candidatus Nanoarchaeia archaeon]